MTDVVKLVLEENQRLRKDLLTSNNLLRRWLEINPAMRAENTRLRDALECVQAELVLDYPLSKIVNDALARPSSF